MRLRGMAALSFCALFVTGVAFAQGNGSPAWPTVGEQLAAGKVQPGSALEKLILANQDFSMLRPEEAKDKIRVPLWLRVYWRKAHPEELYAADDPTGGYPLVLKEIAEWMYSHQDLLPGKPEPSMAPGLAPRATVGTNIRISGLQTTPRSESDIRINYFDPQKIISASNTITGGGFQSQFFSTDGGTTWGQTTLPTTGGDTSHSDPTVDWTSDSTAWSTTIGIQGGTLRMRSYRSTNFGANWAFEATFSGAQTNTDKQMKWIDKRATTSGGGANPCFNNIYATWHNGTPAFVNTRSAGPGTWGAAPIQVSGAESTGTAIGGDIKTNEDGHVFVFWPTTTNRFLFVRKSTDCGATWNALGATPVQIASTFDGFDIGVPSFNSRRALIYASAGAYRTPSKNNVYVTWTDLTGAAGCTTAANEPGANAASTCKTRVWFSRSTDGGTTWSPKAMINDQASLNDQYNQWMIVDPTNGVIGVMYYDTVADATRRKTDVWYQSSFNDGVSWNAPVKVTTAQTDETTGGQDTGNQYGDYNGLSAYAGLFFPSWTDRRSGLREEIWTAMVTDVPCTTPGSPTIGTATPTAPNQVTVTWTNGAPAASLFNVYRATGTCAAPGAFTQIATGVAASPYVDNTVSGGSTYAYQITGTDATGVCQSPPSACAQATATGSCTLPPTFGGLTSVTNNQSAVCQLNLAWTAATANCAGPITYDVFRSTTNGFVPAIGNRIATGVVGTSYNDASPLTSGTTYYYVVRAVDASNSVSETNTTQGAGVPTGPVSVGTFTDTFEGALSGGGFDNAGWTHQAIAGANDWVWQTANVQSPTHSWNSVSLPSVSNRVLTSPPFVVQAATTLSFFHTFRFEGTVAQCFDAGTLEFSTNGGASWSVVPDAAFTAGLFNGTVNGGFSNPLAGKRAWCSGTIGALTAVNVNVFAIPSAVGQIMRLRWHEGDDSSAIGNGWFVDSVVINQAGIAAACNPSPVVLMSLEAE